MATVLSIAPHPDDELLGGGGLLLGLRGAGHRAVVLALTLGRPEQHERRRAELAEACRRADLELRVAAPLLRLSAATAAGEVDAAAGVVASTLAELDPQLVLAPHEADPHHAHNATGRAVRAAVERGGVPRAVAWWSLWGDLPAPNLVVDTDPVLDALAHALDAHAGELARNDYADLLRSRARTAAILGAERVFGFGSPALPCRHADLLTLEAYASSRWRASPPASLPSGAFPRSAPAD